MFINKNKDSASKLPNLIESIAQKEGYRSHTTFIAKLPSSGLNFNAELTEVKITGELLNGGEKELNLFVKTKLPGCDLVKEYSLSEAYRRELFLYKELSQIYKQLEDDAKILTEDKYKFVKCFDESDSQSIIMEDLAKQGFISCDRLSLINIDFAEKCVQELAKFHALSFVLEERDKDYFDKKIKTIQYPIIDNEEYKIFMMNMSNFSLAHLDGEYQQKLQNFIVNMSEKLQTLMKDTNKVKCLCHGDYRAMNIMFKVLNGETSTVMPIDYQFIFYGPPVTDLIYFIIGSTDREFRRLHLATLKTLYHDTMTKFLRYFNIDINNCFPRQEFDQNFRDSLDFSLIIAVCFFPISLADEDELLDLNKTSLNEAVFTVNERFKARLQDVIDDMTEWGHL